MHARIRQKVLQFCTIVGWYNMSINTCSRFVCLRAWERVCVTIMLEPAARHSRLYSHNILYCIKQLFNLHLIYEAQHARCVCAHPTWALFPFQTFCVCAAWWTCPQAIARIRFSSFIIWLLLSYRISTTHMIVKPIVVGFFSYTYVEHLYEPNWFWAAWIRNILHILYGHVRAVVQV